LSLVLPPLDGRLELKGLLGEGGMGQVYRAWDCTLERAVAVKFVRGTDPREAERLLLEARLQARVEHPSVVRVHDTGTLEGRPCIVMQLVEGSSLEVLSPSLDLETKVELLRQAAEGIHAAHRQGLVHRDVKPGNILVEDTPEGLRARVTDFGLARDLDVMRSRSGLPAGTLDFMSPEQLLASGPVEFRTDVYGLGATLFAVLTGCLPFRTSSARRVAGTLPTPELPAEEDIHLLRRILDEDPPQLRSLVPDLPRDLDVVVHMAMQKEPTSRYVTAEAFAQDLAHFQRGEPILARNPGLLDRAAKWTRRNRTAARSLGVAALAILLGLGFAAWTSRRSNLRSLEAARYGALAESMEAGIRMEQLSPSHNLQPVYDRVRAEGEALRAKAAKGGPAAFALGRALELFGDLEGTKEAYQRAWDSGFRSPEVAESLSLAEAQLFDQEVRRARSSLAPEALKRHLQKLGHTLAEPAKRRLNQAGARSWRAYWAQAVLALADKDFEGGRAWARRLLDQEPNRYEALLLECSIWMAVAEDRWKQNQVEEGLAALDEAERCANLGLASGRSDPHAFDWMARIHGYRAKLSMLRGKDSRLETEEAMRWISKAEALLPQSTDQLLTRATIQSIRAWDPREGDVEIRLAIVKDAIDNLTRLHAALPRSIRPLILMADLHVCKAELMRSQGKSMRDTIEQGFTFQRALEALAPEEPMTHLLAENLGFYLGLALQQDGGDAEQAFLDCAAQGKDALRLDTSAAMRAQHVVLLAQTQLGRIAWRKGKDPRPAFQAATSQAEAVLKAFPGNPLLYQAAAYAYGYAAEQFISMDGEVESHLARGMALTAEGLQRNPAFPPLVASMGTQWQLLASWQVLTGQDPTLALKNGRKWTQTASALVPGEVEVIAAVGALALVEAQWKAAQGRDPGPALARSEAALAKSKGQHDVIAAVQLLKAQWAVKQHRSAARELDFGLKSIAKAISEDANDPTLHVIQARLQALAGDGAAARQSLEAARKLNPLIEQGVDFRRAVREAA
jgi:hypothetical protein